MTQPRESEQESARCERCRDYDVGEWCRNCQARKTEPFIVRRCAVCDKPIIGGTLCGGCGVE